jgi:hypothetical protein
LDDGFPDVDQAYLIRRPMADGMDPGADPGLLDSLNAVALLTDDVLRTYYEAGG